VSMRTLILATVCVLMAAGCATTQQHYNWGNYDPSLYGYYMQLQQGKNLAAVDLFKQEESHWPESKVFMDRMIKVASMPTPATTPSAAQ
jgi:hypothetical protein